MPLVLYRLARAPITNPIMQTRKQAQRGQGYLQDLMSRLMAEREKTGPLDLLLELVRGVIAMTPNGKTEAKNMQLLKMQTVS